MSNQNDFLESQVREIYGRVIYTHKTHEKCAEILERKSKCIKIIEIILSAITTTTILMAVFGDGKIAQVIAALFSTATLCLTLYSKDFNLMTIAEKHKQAALSILEIREKLFSLLVDIRIGNKSVTELQDLRNQLNEELINTYRSSPNTSSKAYQLASVALQQNEEFTFTDAEIDGFLPENLRRN